MNTKSCKFHRLLPLLRSTPSHPSSSPPLQMMVKKSVQWAYLHPSCHPLHPTFTAVSCCHFGQKPPRLSAYISVGHVMTQERQSPVRKIGSLHLDLTHLSPASLITASLSLIILGPNQIYSSPQRTPGLLSEGRGIVIIIIFGSVLKSSASSRGWG